MYNLYEIILSLCERQNVKPGRMCNELGVSRGMMTDLKMGRKQTLTAETLSKIAEYFNVTVDYLLGNEKSPTSNELDRQLEGIDFALFGEVHDLTDAEKEDILAFIRFKKSQRKDI